jgi:hypothetical protein
MKNVEVMETYFLEFRETLIQRFHYTDVLGSFCGVSIAILEIAWCRVSLLVFVWPRYGDSVIGHRCEF